MSHSAARRDLQEVTIKQIWGYLLSEDDPVIELRGLHPLSKTTQLRHLRRSDHPDPTAYKAVVEQQALELNDQGYNVYTTINPIRSDFVGKAACDQDIQCRRLLLIDIDRSKPTRQPASENEIKLAKKLAEEVIAFLEHYNPTQPIRLMSGNGVHLYYGLDHVENSVEVSSHIKTILVQLAHRFNNTEAKIDTVVYNPARITKVPGTVMRKGEETAERPFRIAELFR